jgi:hypothetical protein
MVKVLKVLKVLNFWSAGQIQFFATARGKQVMRRPSSQDRGDVRTAQMALPVALADPVRD